MTAVTAPVVRPGCARQLARRHAAGLIDQVDAAHVGAVHAEAVRDRLVEVVVRRLVGAEHLAALFDDRLTA